MSNYQEFLANKAKLHAPTGIAGDIEINPALWDFAQAIVKVALRRGRCAIFAGTGLSKTAMQVEWAKHVADYTGKPVLIIAPLAVSAQTIAEAKNRLGYDVQWTNSGEHMLSTGSKISITNYGKIHKFDYSVLGGIVLDESSIIKNEDGYTSNFLIEACQRILFRLCCTATPSPNDLPEIGNHAAILGIMTMAEMLAMFFVHDGGETQKWRLKGHAEEEFYAWMASWCIAVQNPKDLGFDGSQFILPELKMHERIVASISPEMDGLLIKKAATMTERRKARKTTINERVAEAVKLAERPGQWFFWCNLNDESKAIANGIPDAVEVTGSDSDEHKAKTILDFAAGKTRVVVSKPGMCGYGLNLQKCHKTAFIGLNDSFEQFFQAVRRFWRFGQKHPVECHVIISDQEGAVLENIKRKEADAEKMYQALVANMSEITKGEIEQTRRTLSKYETESTTDNGWKIYLGDCVEVAQYIPDNSIDYSIFSPPFASLYTYSNSDRDMGNCKNDSEFYEHYKFLISELYRIIKPGRLVSFHCMNLPTSKCRDGYIGIRDFRGDLIRMMQACGFIYHAEVVIWKDPVTAMQRTKALGLLYKQLRKDSAMSRQGIPDYLVTMRKPGENPDPVTKCYPPTDGRATEAQKEDSLAHPERVFPIDLWQKYASPVWMDIAPNDTLTKGMAREEEDERHICALQLEVIRRGIRLWTNKGDWIFSPFVGIGSEIYVAVQEKRNAIGSELKRSYYEQAIANMRALKDAETKAAQEELQLQLT